MLILLIIVFVIYLDDVSVLFILNFIACDLLYII